MLVINIIFGVMIPAFMTFLCGIWTVLPEGINEKFSPLVKKVVSLLWLVVGLVFSLMLLISISSVWNNYLECNELSSACINKKNENINIIEIILLFPIMLYSLGFLFGKWGEKHLLERNNRDDKFYIDNA